MVFGSRLGASRRAAHYASDGDAVALGIREEIPLHLQGTYSSGVSSTTQTSERGTPATVAALVCLVEGLGLAAVAVLYARELMAGAADEPSIAGMALALTLVFAGLLLVLARAWWSRRQWPRTPTIVWNLLLLPAIWTLHTTNGAAVSVPLLVLALAGIAAAALAPAVDRSDDALY